MAAVSMQGTFHCAEMGVRTEVQVLMDSFSSVDVYSFAVCPYDHFQSLYVIIIIISF